MVKTLLRSALREIRQSMGRYLAILAIVGLGVGFFAGLRACQPDMMVTGVKYLEEHGFYDFRLLSTLGFTNEDVAAFAAREGVEAARGAVFTDFLTEIREGHEVVVKAHSITEDINTLKLSAGRMPEAPNECLGDAKYFLEEDLGRVLPVNGDNSEDTRELLKYGGYTVVGLAWSPYYLNYERGTSSLGSGSVAGFVYIPEEGFDFEAYHEIFLAMADAAEPYSDAYGEQMDAWEPEVEDFLEQRAELRYTTLYDDAMEEIRDAEQEIADGWDDYHREKADAEQELDDAYRELTDGESDYEQGQKDFEQGQVDYEQGRRDYADGRQKVSDAQKELDDAQKEVADGEQELVEARRELDDGWAEYNQAKADAERELADAYQKLLDGEREYADGLAEYNDGLKQLEDAEAEIADGERELQDGQRQLNAAESQLNASWAQLESGRQQLEASRAQLDAGEAQYAAGYQKLQQAAAASGVPIETLLATPEGIQLTTLRSTLDAGWQEYNAGLQEYQYGYAQYQEGAAKVAPVSYTHLRAHETSV